MGVCGCAAPLPDIYREDAVPPAELKFQPALVDGVAEAVFRVEVADAGEAGVVPLRLFAGDLSSYDLRGIAKDEVSRSLAERELKLRSWPGSGGGSILAPEAALPEGIYTLASSEGAVLREFRVESERPVFTRVWPGSQASSSSTMVFCHNTAQPAAAQLEAAGETDVQNGSEPVQLWLGLPGLESTEAGFERVAVSSQFASFQCLSLQAGNGRQLPFGFVPPVSAFGVLLDPAPLGHEDAVPPVPTELSAECVAEEFPIGPGCIEVQDDRLIVRPPAGESLWSVVGSDHHWVRVSDGPARFVLRGLAPNTRQGLRFTILHPGGTDSVDVQVSTPEASAHVVINEVMPNPVGMEPEQEWVELYNDGTIPVCLRGWVFEDVGGSALLPDLRLPPGAFALLVGPGYLPDGDYDAVAVEGTPVLVLEKLANQGLSNSGELVRLRDSLGRIVSRLAYGDVLSEDCPDSAGTAENGVSVARLHPWSLDESQVRCEPHAGAKSSPGGHNTSF
ncbi:MAG: lamin tail domain-containing protein [Polyangiaceae bacterium]|nr:lamin tail domain-containing protein [Polyangiaceae bacterium]